MTRRLNKIKNGREEKEEEEERGGRTTRRARRKGKRREMWNERRKGATDGKL